MPAWFFFFLKKFTFFYLFIYLFIYLWLCWVFVSVRGLSLVAASGGHSSARCAGLSLSRPLLLRSTGSRRAGSVIVAHGPSCSVACGIFPHQGSNPCPLHWQTDSQPLRHQGSPPAWFFTPCWWFFFLPGCLKHSLSFKFKCLTRKYLYVKYSKSKFPGIQCFLSTCRFSSFFTLGMCS